MGRDACDSAYKRRGQGGGPGTMQVGPDGVAELEDQDLLGAEREQLLQLRDRGADPAAAGALARGRLALAGPGVKLKLGFL